MEDDFCWINQGDTLALGLFGKDHTGKPMGKSLITEKGVAIIEGQALENVVLLGCVT